MPLTREDITAYKTQENPELQAEMEARRQKWQYARAAVDAGNIAEARAAMEELRAEAEARYRRLYGGVSNG